MRDHGHVGHRSDRGFVAGVVIPEQYGYYGDVSGISVNAMYNRYVTWFVGKYGTSKQPLSFRDWLVWARNKGFVNAAGDKTQATVAAPKDTAAAKQHPVAGRVQRIITIAILLGIASYVGYELYQNYKKKKS